VLIEFMKAQPGTLHLCMEEGTQSTRLVEVLTPYLADIVVTHVSESSGPKSAERRRIGAIEKSVFKQMGAFATLRELYCKAHEMVVRDTTRTKNRPRAQFRARGVRVDLYTKRRRETWLAMLPPSSQIAARLLFAQLNELFSAHEKWSGSAREN
jgi:hypothetical protein